MIISSILINMVSIYLHAQELGSKYGIDPALVIAIVRTESGFNPKAVGAAGEIGLMQLHPRYHKHVKFEIKANMEQGIAYLAKLKDKCYPALREAWPVCYNTGVRKALALDEPKQFSYYKKVKKNYAQAKKDLYNSRASSPSKSKRRFTASLRQDSSWQERDCTWVVRSKREYIVRSI